MRHLGAALPRARDRQFGVCLGTQEQDVSLGVFFLGHGRLGEFDLVARELERELCFRLLFRAKFSRAAFRRLSVSEPLSWRRDRAATGPSEGQETYEY